MQGGGGCKKHVNTQRFDAPPKKTLFVGVGEKNQKNNPAPPLCCLFVCCVRETNPPNGGMYYPTETPPGHKETSRPTPSGGTTKPLKDLGLGAGKDQESQLPRIREGERDTERRDKQERRKIEVVGLYVNYGKLVFQANQNSTEEARPNPKRLESEKKDVRCRGNS